MPKDKLAEYREEDLSDPTGQGQMHILRSNEPDEVRRWMKAMCVLADKTPSQLAKEAGLAPSTINKFLNNPEYKHIPSTRTLGMFSMAADSAYTDRVKIGYGQGQWPESSYGYTEPGRAGVPPFTQRVDQIVVPFRESAMVLGTVQAGIYSEASEWPPDDRYPVPVLDDPDFYVCPKFGLEVAGDSMDLVYPPGSIVVCVTLPHVDRNPLPGERVVVQRRNSANEIEATLKEYQIDNDGVPWLWPRSSNPDFQSPIRYDQDAQQGDEVRITAIVIMSIQPEKRPAGE